MIGGGTTSGLPSILILEVAALPLLLVIGWPRGLGRLVAVLLGLVFTLFVLQLLPFWGRPAVAISYLSPALGVSLTSSADMGRTLDAFAFTLAAGLVFLGFASLRPAGRRLVLNFLLIGGAANLALGLVQAGAGRELTLAVAGYPMRLGCFANPNHFATLIDMLMPLLALRLRDRSPLWTVAAVAFMLLAAVAAGSLAGVALAAISALLSLALVVPVGRKSKAAALLVVVVSAALLLPWVATQLAQQIGMPLNRLTFALTTLRATSANLPLGSGFGTFALVYPQFVPAGDIGGAFVNHAHDDYLELLLEGGVLAALALGLYLFLVASTAMRRLAEKPAAAAAVTLAVVLLHSLVDYPLRAMAISVVFALANAMLLAPAERAVSRRR